MIALIAATWISAAHAQSVTTERSEECGCSVQTLHGLRDMPRVGENAAIHLGVHGRQMYFTVHVYPREDYELQTLAGLLHDRAWVEGYEALGDLEYGTVARLPAAWGDFTYRWTSEEDDRKLKVHMRTWVVDAGDRMLVLDGWSVPKLWYDNGPRLQEVVDSLLVAPPDEDARGMNEWAVDLHALPFAEARATHTPARRTHPYRDELEKPPKGSGWRRVTYAAGPGPMQAYLHEAPERGPGVVWVPQGVFDPDARVADPPRGNAMSATAFTEAGLTTLVPSFRGMAENPGEAEYFYGEVDDLLAAIAHLKSLGSVDPERVYVVGLGTGGTLALLAGVAEVDVRAIVTIGGAAWQFPVMALGGYPRQPFAVDDEDATGFRSAIHWADRIRSPVRYLSLQGSYDTDARMMTRFATEAGRDMALTAVPLTDRVAVLGSLQKLIVDKIRADAGGRTTSVAFTEREIYRRLRAEHPQDTRLGR